MKTLEIVFWISVFVVFYTYIGYGIVLWVLVKVKETFRPRKEPRMPDELPEVTLFVAAYNEERVVDEKMANTRSLDYPADRLKVVGVTDGSDDSTNRRLEAYPEVEVFFQPERQGKTAALNRGIEFVETSLVVFTDANTMLNREAIREIVRCFSDPTVGCVAGEKRIAVRRLDGAAAGGEGLYWKYESALKRLDWRLYSAMGAAGELFSVRRGLFERMENDTLLDDFVLSLRIVQKGYRIAYCDTAYAIEGASSDMKEEQKRKVRICAGGLQSIGRLRPLLNVFRYGVVSFMFLSHRVLRWSLTPLLLFLLLPVNAALAFSGSPLYITFLALQLAFYAAALGGYYLATRAIRNKYLFVPYYFLFMNVNVIRGFCYLRKKRGSGSGAWEKAKRA